MARKLIIIGAGAAGFAAMIRANELGVKPTLIGKGPIGGTCVNVGCVPTKKMLSIGEAAAKQPCDQPCVPPLEDAVKAKDALVTAMRKAKYEDVLASYDVEYIEGHAHFISPRAVKVNGESLEAEKFIVATGSSPIIPDIRGLREAGYWTNVEALSPNRRVESLVVIGGRAQALEFAQMYRRLGVEVALLQRSRALIPDWEPEISLAAAEVLQRDGVSIHLGVSIKEVRRNGEAKMVSTNLGDVEADEVLIAAGRRPNTDIGLDAAGVKLGENGGIWVTDYLATSNPSIYAAGDVLGGPMLEALAGRQGALAAENALTGSRKGVDLMSVPRAIFIQPNAASVGQRSINSPPGSRWSLIHMRDVAKANILDSTLGLIKMGISGEGRIIGVHMLGENAAEVINEAALAIRLGATIDDLIDTVHVFPTMAESIKLAAISFRRDVSKMSCCVD
ncbi:MAG: mercury(II) reductase [Thermocladium sp.]